MGIIYNIINVFNTVNAIKIFEKIRGFIRFKIDGSLMITTNS